MSIDKTSALGITGLPDTVSEVPAAPKQSKLGAIFSTIAKVGGAAVSAIAPGVGPIIGGILGGKSLGVPTNFSGGMLGPESSQFLQYQQQMTMEMRAFELASTILKNRHDASMSAIRNMKS
jgi:hypothetical protein